MAISVAGIAIAVGLRAPGYRVRATWSAKSILARPWAFVATPAAVTRKATSAISRITPAASRRRGTTAARRLATRACVNSTSSACPAATVSATSVGRVATPAPRPWTAVINCLACRTAPGSCAVSFRLPPTVELRPVFPLAAPVPSTPIVAPEPPASTCRGRPRGLVARPRRLRSTEELRMHRRCAPSTARAVPPTPIAVTRFPATSVPAGTRACSNASGAWPRPDLGVGVSPERAALRTAPRAANPTRACVDLPGPSEPVGCVMSRQPRVGARSPG
jgi:hypothetical protein